ncbi:MAG TPA: glycosyltransferase [Rhodopila sp.]|jgi:predicted LPLAT superfamily acyltransferase|nr:glycosyltransferase [Rhodopila sp.]
MTGFLRLCAIVPTHNHWRALGRVVRALRDADLPVLIIDDGSDEPAATAIAVHHRPDAGIQVHRLPTNQGKGVAVIHGMRLAWEAGYTHAVQIDADGQHDTASLPALLMSSHQHPTALVSAAPIFDASMPRGRRIGRWITHIWVWIETLSLQITDSMCGFRVYPLTAVKTLLQTQSVGRRMDFDTDIMVRLFWQGTPIQMVPTRVIYPRDNTSNFRPWADNLRIAAMHTRLVLRLLTCPIRPQHWSRLPERGAWSALLLTAFTARMLGRRFCLTLLAPVVAYFLLAARRQRRASRAFLTQVTGRPPSTWTIYRHFMSFAARALDSFLAWTGGIQSGAATTDTPDALARLTADPRGALLVVAHLGNTDLARALLDDTTSGRLTILVHTGHAVNYNRLLRKFRPQAALNLIQVSEIGPETAIDLQQRIDRGEWVVIAGDRTPISGTTHVSVAPFLGKDAGFPNGPWILAALLRCPVHLLFCVRIGIGWRMTLEPFADQITLDRKHRRAALQAHAEAYAQRLEAYARAFPLQWYNFFDFWA